MSIENVNHTNINNNRIEWLASLRGLAVFLVFFSHCTKLPINRDCLFVLGKIGVAGFFLMAGYLAKTALEKRSLPQYAINRFLRLYPVYWILLFLTICLAPIDSYSIPQIFANTTLFQEYLGYGNILGAAWMLSIMVILYVILAFCKKNSVKYVPIAFYILCVLAILCGLGRCISGKPLPTALFLMSAVGCLGYIFKNIGERYGAIKLYLIIFEITLLIASYLSYDMRFLLYLLSYNTAFVLVYFFRRYNVNVSPLIFIGSMGFTFFLGAGIPIRIVTLIAPSVKELASYVYVTIQFILVIPFAWAVTKYIETPLLKWGKKIEKKI